MAFGVFFIFGHFNRMVIEIVSGYKSWRVWDPLPPKKRKNTIPLLLGLIRAPLVVQFRFYDHLKISHFFVVLVWSFPMQILKCVANFQMMSNKSDIFVLNRYALDT